MWHVDDGMGWWMVLGSLWFVFFWGAIIWLVVRVLGARDGGAPRDDSAIEVARRRYARGDISREEFEQIRRDLTA